MKGLSIKRLAAIATGAALVGSALVPMVAAQITKNDIYNANGTPKVNVVVGAKAQVSDAIWAGNIAAKIAEKATRSTAVSCSGEAGAAACEATLGDITVDLQIGGETTYSTEASKTYDDNYLDSNSLSGPEYIRNLKQAQLGFLYNSTDTYRYAGTSYSIVMKEEVGIKADTKYEKAKEVMDLVAYLDDAHDFNYTLDLGQGIPITESTGQAYTSSANKFVDSANDHIAIPWFGEKYIVNQIDCSSGQASCLVELIKQTAEESYEEGEEITGLTGRGNYAGQELTAKFVSISQTGPASTTYSAKFELYDAAGNLIDTVTSSTGNYLNTTFYDAEGEFALDTVLYVSDIAVGSTTQLGTITVTKGSNVIQIKNGYEYPYDSTDTNSENDYWMTGMTFGTDSSPDVNTLLKIEIYNNITKWDKTKGPLYTTDDCLTSKCSSASGASIEAPFLYNEESAVGYGFVKIKFDGFKEDKTYAAAEIGGGSCTTGSQTLGCIKWTDNRGDPNNIPMAIKLPLSEEVLSFTVDGQTYYYKCNQTAANEYVDINVATTDKINGWETRLQSRGNDDDNVLIAAYGSPDVNYAESGTVYLKGNAFTLQAAGDGNVTLRADGNCSFASTSLSGTNVQTATYLAPSNTTGAMAIGPYKSIYYEDTPTYGPVGCAFDTNMVLGLTGGVEENTHYYAVYVNEAESELWLLLDDQSQFRIENGVSSGDDFNLLGTDSGYIGTVEDRTIDGNETCFIPDDTAFSGGNSGDGHYWIATFLVDDDGDSAHDARIYIDTADGKYIDLPNNELSNYAYDVNYLSSSTTSSLNRNNEDWALRDDDATKYATAAYTDFGSKYSLSGGTVKVSIPDAAPYISLTVLGEGATTVVTGAEDLLDIAVGDTAETAAGTKITVAAVDAPCSCEAGDTNAGTCTPSVTSCVSAVAVSNPIVYLDTDNPAGTNIIVGGHIVNRLAAQITGLANRLTSRASEPILEVDAETGNIIVAGYTAQQTGEAAQDLIDEIDAFD